MASLGFARVGGLVLRQAIVLAAVLLGAGCIPRIPVQRLPKLTPIAVAYVADPSFAGDSTTAPDKLKAAIAEVLAERNLQPVEVPLETVKNTKLTDARMASIRESPGPALSSGGAQNSHGEPVEPRASEPPFILLIELRVHFFSQLDGRYRWEVGTALTVERRNGTQVKDAFEVPVVLMFDHEKQEAAMVAATPDIGNRLAVLIDGLLASPGGPATKSASTGPSSIYFVMVDRFLNGNHTNDADADPSDPTAFHGGDLDGLIERLDWLQGLGIDTLWLSPLFAMRTEKYHGYGAFHGYWTYDLNAVEPRFGTEQTVKKLSAEVHKRGMKLMLDLVLNHVGPDAPLLTAHPTWFHTQGGVKDWHDAQQLENGDVHGLSDLAQENPEVAAYLSAATRRWLRPRRA